MQKIILFIFSALLLLAPVSVSAAGLFEGYALAEGTITAKDAAASSAFDNYCDLSYVVTIDGVEYPGQSEGFSDFCHLETDDTVKIKYLVSDPRKHSVASEFEIRNMSNDEVDTGLFGVVALFIALVTATFMIVIITKVIRGRKKADVDGDGLAGDDRPATAEQKKLIQEGFRRLGVHHEVKKRLTQAQARETLREIERKLRRK